MVVAWAGHGGRTLSTWTRRGNSIRASVMRLLMGARRLKRASSVGRVYRGGIFPQRKEHRFGVILRSFAVSDINSDRKGV